MRGYQNVSLDQRALRERYHRDHFNSKKTLGFFNASEKPVFGRFAPKNDVVINKPVVTPENACERQTRFFANTANSHELLNFGTRKIKHNHEGMGNS